MTIREAVASRNVAMAMVLAWLVASCATTTVTFAPARADHRVCQAQDENLRALVLWTTEWRADQKDVPERVAAAEQGIARFFASSGCFADAEIRHIDPDALRKLDIAALAAQGPIDHVLVITVRELGPVVKLFASAALVDGGTEVVLDIRDYARRSPGAPREITVHWQNGGPGVVKGVSTLPADMEAALVASLEQPPDVAK